MVIYLKLKRTHDLKDKAAKNWTQIYNYKIIKYNSEIRSIRQFTEKVRSHNNATIFCLLQFHFFPLHFLYAQQERERERRGGGGIMPGGGRGWGRAQA
jgi:hypothetical protein